MAWAPLGWRPAWYSEIEPFPCAVLAYRHPGVPNLGDMTTIHEKQEFKNGAIDLLVGGTPCQSFSVAGLRKGMADPRGNLALVFLRIADLARPRWIVWENVPGVLSSNRGRDFGAFLGALGQLGYGWSYRIMDAQFFGVPQRRRRVFVVGYLGDWRRAAAVLFEPDGLRRNPAPGGKARTGVAALEAQVRRARAEAFEEAAVWMDGHLCEYCVTNHLPNPLKKLDDAEAEFCPRTSCWDIDAVRKHFRERASALRSQAAKEK